MSYPIQVVTPKDQAFPSLLRQIKDVPSQLYVRGNIEALHRTPLIAVVGSRKANQYGHQCITDLLTPVVRAGVSVVSGLAYGIDSLAHRVCIDHHVPTVAVLGSAVDDDAIYPKAHLTLAHEILKQGGAVISEYAPGSVTQQRNFPARNRIIAGLAPATLLIQASERSGSLITARLALESGRDVWATPGPITDPLSHGTNRLIQEGASPILSSTDIFHLLGIDTEEKPALKQAELFPS